MKTPSYILKCQKEYYARHKYRYKCLCCNYFTHSRTNFERHKKTKKCQRNHKLTLSDNLAKLSV